MSNKIFKEKQRFRSVEVIALLALLIVGICYKSIQEMIVTGEFFSVTQLLYIGSVILTGLTIRFLLNMRLKTAISEKEIQFKLAPFHNEKKRIRWKDVASCKIVKTPLAAQYHGNNITFNNEKRFSFSGRNGVLLKTNEGDRYFIGTRKLDQFSDAISKVFEE